MARAAPTRETDEAFPRVASLRQPPPPKPQLVSQGGMLGALGPSHAPPAAAAIPKPVAPPATGYAGNYFDTPAPAAADAEPVKVEPFNPLSAKSSPKTYDRLQKDATSAPDFSAFAQEDQSQVATGASESASFFSQAKVASPHFDYGTPTQTGNPPLENQTFLISFNRETSELKAVLEALKNVTVSEEKLFGGSGTVTERLAMRSELLGRLGWAFLRSRWGLLLLGLLLGLLIIFLVIRLGAPVGSTTQPIQTASLGQAPLIGPGNANPGIAGNEGTIAAANSIGAKQAEPVGQGGVRGQTANQINPGATDIGLSGQPPLIRSEAGREIWYPHKGDSLWVFYSWIRNHPDQAARFQDLLKGEWQGFLAQISAANPHLTFPDAIYPDKAIIIH